MKADWNRGVWLPDDDAGRALSGEAAERGGERGASDLQSPETGPKQRPIRLTIASDWAPLKVYADLIQSDPTAVYGDVLPLLRASDLNLVNVECTLGNHGEPIPKAGPNFRAEESSVRSLTEVPFHVACLANNHSMDYGPESLNYTMDLLQKAGLEIVGAGMSGEEAARPLVVDVGSVRVAVINCAEGEACRSVDNGPGANGFEPAAAARQIRELKRTADFVLVVFHGGREYAPLPPEYVIAGLRGMAEAGASAVIAHHPHVPQGIEVYRGVPIVYSQGNFVFWQDSPTFFRHAGYLVHLDVLKDRIAKMEITPYTIEPEGLSMMKGALKTRFLQTLAHVSELIADPAKVRDVWNAFVDGVGLSGLIRTLQSPMKQLETDLPVGAARLLNLFFTPAHSELFITGLRRAVNGRLGDSPEWAKRLVDHWMNCGLEEGKERCGEYAP
jgi:poly-gamma-glutamate synthesis protein (capsule biosynthesis protein)